MTIWFNTTDYTIPEHVLFIIGALLWVVVYIVYVRSVIVEKRIMIPAFIVCADIAWEFLRGFIYPPNMGEVYVWGYRIWFFLDIIITYGAFVYGAHQVDSPVVKKYFKPILAFNLVAWFALLYFLIPQYDDPVGLFSAFIVNIGISTLYLLLMLRRPVWLFSILVGFCKMTGTFLIGVFGMIRWPENHFLMTMVILTFTIDLSYFMILIYRYSLVGGKNTSTSNWFNESEALIPPLLLKKLKQKQLIR